MLLKWEFNIQNLFNVAVKKDFIALKAEVDELDINKFFNVPTALNNLWTKIYDLDGDKFKIVSVDLKKLSNTVSKKIVKKVVCNNLNTKVNDLENKIPGVSSLIQTNQYKTDQKSLEKKIWILGKKKKLLTKNYLT